MSEFIGSRISLISKSDIRYVGTLHEINSESSTVALENVTSYGTEGRRNNPKEEIPASDSVYEYIVFRGSDVKDLRIEEAPKENKPPPPPVPNDPAILGAARPPPQSAATAQQNMPSNQQQQIQHPPFSQAPHQPGYGNVPPFQAQRFGPAGGYGPAGGFGYPPMPYGVPPPWYGPPGQQYPPPPGPFGQPGPQMPAGQFGQQAQQMQNQKPPQQGNTGSVSSAGPESTPQPASLPTDASSKAQDTKPPNAAISPAPALTSNKGPPPPVESKPDVAAALATPALAVPTVSQGQSAPKSAPTGPKNGRIIPVVPIPSPNTRTTGTAPTQPAATNAPIAAPSQASEVAANAALQYQNATQAATAAVAAAMAKLPPAQNRKQNAEITSNSVGAVDNLTKKVNEMRMDDRNRHSKHSGSGGPTNHREGRGARRGGGRDQQTKPFNVPATDYDFESANAKFNKQDLVKEAIATGSPLGENAPHEAHAGPNGTDAASNANGASASSSAKVNGDVTIPPPAASTTYNKATSFFDNISSELKDREEASGRRLGGQEFRSEERKKNLETFGQGSIDGGYRGGFRGRGRGRGFRGRGGYSRGRGGGRGGAHAQAQTQPQNQPATAGAGTA